MAQGRRQEGLALLERARQEVERGSGYNDATHRLYSQVSALPGARIQAEKLSDASLDADLIASVYTSLASACAGR